MGWDGICHIILDISYRLDVCMCDVSKVDFQKGEEKYSVIAQHYCIVTEIE